MEFFDALISDFTALCKNGTAAEFTYDKSKVCEENSYSKVILQRDTACELDGTGVNLVTGKPVSDEIVLIGKDIDALRGKDPFARVCIVQLEDTADEQQLYSLIRKVEYIKYHFFPEGYMIRSSSRNHKEGIRISKKAQKKGLSFEHIGNLLINKYKQNPAVKGVKVIFITDPSFGFETLTELAQKSNRITETLNHIINSVKFDCDSCNLKPICDEVEGMKELHFKNMQMGS